MTISTLTSRRTTVLTALVVSIVLLIVANIEWYATTATTVLDVDERISVSGQDIMPLLSAAAFVGIAASLFIAIAHRIGLYIAGAVVVLCGIGAGAASVLAPSAAPGRLAQEVVSSVGVASGPVAEHGSVMPLIAGVCGVLLLWCGFVTTARAHRWNRTGQQYQRPVADMTQQVSQDLDARDTWDALSRGEDPSAGRTLGDTEEN